MSVFDSPDLVPLWDRPPEFLPLRPPGGAHRWRYGAVKQELEAVSRRLGKEAGDRRVALLNHPELGGAAATDGLHAGIQLLLAGESAAPHRHTPAALRVGLEATDIVTTVGNTDLALDPLDVVLNPAGTWHGHTERAGAGGLWLDIVDLPMVAALGGVLFEPTMANGGSPLLDPPIEPPETVRYPWSATEALLAASEARQGVRSCCYGDGEVLPTLAVTAFAVDGGATLRLPARTAGAIALIGRGGFDLEATRHDGRLSTSDLSTFDVISLRSWTSASLACVDGPGIVIVIDSSPALKRLGLYREEPAV